MIGEVECEVVDTNMMPSTVVYSLFDLRKQPHLLKLNSKTS